MKPKNPSSLKQRIYNTFKNNPQVLKPNITQANESIIFTPQKQLLWINNLQNFHLKISQFLKPNIQQFLTPKSLLFFGQIIYDSLNQYFNLSNI